MVNKPAKPKKKWIAPALAIGIAGMILSLLHFSADEAMISVTDSDIPVVMGHREGCFLCHRDMSGFSPSHDPGAIGCSACHGGNPLTRDKERAHSGMFVVPGNMDNAGQTCGRAECHQDLVHRVTGSLMASGRGMVSVNRYVFGQAPSPDGPGHLSHLTDSAADTHLRQLCVTCHLGFPKTRARPLDEKSRGGGCTACHINYTASAKQDLARYHKSGELPKKHPDLNIRIQNERCFGCHSRSARISLNYEGWHETLLSAGQSQNIHQHRILQDGRVLEFKGADVHHEKNMLCIDCHTARDAMGDGISYNHQGEQVETTCIDCHRQSPAEFVPFSRLDTDSVKILQLRDKKDRKKARYLVSHRSGKPLINLIEKEDGSVGFRGKLDDHPGELNPPAASCSEISGHSRLTCQACHTRWAPTCIECHTQYLPNRKRRDHYTGKILPGVWKEYKGDLRAVSPALGVRKEKRTGRAIVDTFIPGMILTIAGMRDHHPDPNAPPRKDLNRYQIFRRMFSPTFSHTIQRESRSCESCHQNPWSVGLGAGRIEYGAARNRNNQIPMRFFPKSGKHAADGLPRDAWTSFLSTRTRQTSTRIGARPFNAEEQQRILVVGQCLICHQPTDKNRATLYRHFTQALARRSAQCLKSPARRWPTRDP